MFSKVMIKDQKGTEKIIAPETGQVLQPKRTLLDGLRVCSMLNKCSITQELNEAILAHLKNNHIGISPNNNQEIDEYMEDYYTCGKDDLLETEDIIELVKKIDVQHYGKESDYFDKTVANTGVQA